MNRESHYKGALYVENETSNQTTTADRVGVTHAVELVLAVVSVGTQ